MLYVPGLLTPGIPHAPFLFIHTSYGFCVGMIFLLVRRSVNQMYVLYKSDAFQRLNNIGLHLDRYLHEAML